MDRLVDVLFLKSKLILLGWAVLTLALGAFAVGLESRAVPGGEASSTSQAEAVARQLSADGVPSLFVVVTGVAATRGETGNADLAAIRQKVAAVPGVREVSVLPLPPVADPVGVGPVTVLGVASRGGVDASIDVARRLLDVEDLAPRGSKAFLGGYGAHREELVELSRSDLIRAEKVGLPIVAVVLLLTFGSLWASLVPLVIGLAALLGGLGAAGALAFGVPFSEYVTNAASMVGLALAVDYAMFLVQRVRERMLAGADVDEAIRTAMRTTGVAIAWSGLTVLLAQSTMFLVDARSIRTAALGMMLVTLAAMLAALVGAPLVIRLLGVRILSHAGRRHLRRAARGRTGPAHRLQARPQPQRSGFWQSWGELVVRRPTLWLLSATAILVALCLPALHLSERVDLPSAGAMPADSQVRQATELGVAAFGPGVLSPVEIVVHGDPSTVPEQAARVAKALQSDAQVRGVQVHQLGEPERFRVSAATVSAPADPSTADLVRSLRDGELRRDLAGIRYEVGGEAAMRVDAKQALFDSLPLMLAALLLLVLVVFVLAMRSVVLPLKAVALVVLSLGATAGGLLLASTTDLGAELIGWSEPQNLHPIVPITIVAMVVALSTDYEVILISRIAESYERSGDNTASIVDGIAKTGRVISSAAAIMIAVFLGFALSDVTPLRQLGVGLAFAVFIDATLVRGVLVPASMQLMGRWNWWLPAAWVRARAAHLVPTFPAPDVSERVSNRA